MLQLTPQINARPMFVTDEADSGRVVPVLLWLGVIGVLVRVTVFMRVREMSEFASVDKFVLVQMCAIAFLFAVLTMSFRFGPVVRNLWSSSGGLLLAYYLLCAVSAAWSPMPAYSFYRAVEVIVLMSAIFAALSYSPDFDSAELTVLRICLLALILGPVGWAKLRGWNLWSDNGSTASAAMIFCYCLGEFSSRAKSQRRMLYGCALLSLVFVLTVGGSASMIAMACCAIVIAFISQRHRYLLVLMLAGLILVRLCGEHVLYQIFFRGKTVEQVRSLHGRVSLWQDLMEVVASSPLYGQGFAVAPRLIGRGNTHNGLLAVFTGTGALGLIIVTLGVVRLLKELWSSIRTHQPGAVGCAAALTAGLINCLTVPVIGEYWRPESLVFICFLALHLWQWRHARDGTGSVCQNSYQPSPCVGVI